MHETDEQYACNYKYMETSFIHAFSAFVPYAPRVTQQTTAPVEPVASTGSILQPRAQSSKTTGLWPRAAA